MLSSSLLLEYLAEYRQVSPEAALQRREHMLRLARGGRDGRTQPNGRGHTASPSSPRAGRRRGLLGRLQPPMRLL
jgi:hypothetical protein